MNRLLVLAAVALASLKLKGAGQEHVALRPIADLERLQITAQVKSKTLETIQSIQRVSPHKVLVRTARVSPTKSPVARSEFRLKLSVDGTWRIRSATYWSGPFLIVEAAGGNAE